MEDRGEEAFKEQLRTIAEATAKAQHYLDRTAPKSPEHSTLPRAHWRETGTQWLVAQPGQPRCGAKAIEQVETTFPYSPSLVLRNPETCIRPRGHDGEHASEIVHHQYRHSRWKALAWD